MSQAKVHLTHANWDGWEEVLSVSPGEGKPASWGFKESVPTMTDATPPLAPGAGTVAECKARCILSTLCVAFERKAGICTYYKWEPAFKEGEGSHVDYAGFVRDTYFEEKSGPAGPAIQVFIHRAVAVSADMEQSAGVKTNFEINLMTSSVNIGTSSTTFTAHVAQKTIDFQHTYTRATVTVQVTHLAVAPAVINPGTGSGANPDGGFEDTSSNSVTGRITYGNTNSATCGVTGATVTAYQVNNDGVTFFQNPPKSLGPPSELKVTDPVGEFTVTIPRDTRTMLVVDYWDSTKPATCGNATWVALSCPPPTSSSDNTPRKLPSGTSWELLKAYHWNDNACGCKHDFSLAAGQDAHFVLTNDDKANYDYTDTTTRALTVEAFGGACRMALGTLAMKVQGLNCIAYVATSTIPEGSISTTFASVPAMPLDVVWDTSVIATSDDAREGISKGHVDAQLMEGGSTAKKKLAALTWSDQTVQYMYKAATVLSVELNTAPRSCTSGSDFSSKIMKQGKNYTAFVTVSEQYGDGAQYRCYNVKGSVKVEDSISNRRSPCHPLSFTGASSCSISFESFPKDCVTDCYESSLTVPIWTGDPNYNDVANGFTRMFRVTLEQDPTEVYAERVVVLGHAIVGEGFSMKLPEILPTLILRDPPGSGSFSTYEKSVSNSLALTMSRVDSTGNNANVAYGFGYDNDFELCVGLGAASCQEAGSVKLWADGELSHSKERADASDTSSSFTNTVTETFTTSANPGNPGKPATAYLVPTISILFALSKFVKFDADTCAVTVNEDTTWQMGPSDPNSMTWTTRWHTENIEIPRLNKNLKIESDRDTVDAEKVAHLQRSIKGWQDIIKLDDDNVQAAIDNQKSFSDYVSNGGVADVPLEPFATATAVGKDQIGFVGYNGGYDYSTTATASTSTSVSFELTTSDFKGITITEAASVFGVGFSQEVGISQEVTIGIGQQSESSREESTTVGFHLEDDSLGDYFDVRVLVDTVYGTPVFETVSGATMCPHEVGTVAREQVELTTDKSSITSIPEGSPAIFNLVLNNLAPVDSCAALNLELIAETNPHGLRVRAFGKEFSKMEFGCLQFEAHTISIEVYRGPILYKNYPKLQFQLYSACEDALGTNLVVPKVVSVIDVEVSWLEPCPSVQWASKMKELESTKNPWAITQASPLNPHMEVMVYNPAYYTGAWSTNSRLQSIQLQYRRPSDSTWSVARQVMEDGTFTTADFIQSEDSFGYSAITWKADHFEDGAYVLRVVSKCTASTPPNPSIDSSLTSGRDGFIDRKPPVQFGLPEPTDGEYWPGDPISFTFAEELDCSKPYRFQLTMNRVDNQEQVPLLIVCEKRTISMELDSSSAYDNLMGKAVEVEVVNIFDKAGNQQYGVNSFQFHFAIFNLCRAKVELSQLVFDSRISDAISDERVLKSMIATQLAATAGTPADRLHVLRINGDANGDLKVDIIIDSQCTGTTATTNAADGASADSAVSVSASDGGRRRLEVESSSSTSTVLAAAIIQAIKTSDDLDAEYVADTEADPTTINILVYASSSSTSARTLVRPSSLDPATKRHASGLLNSGEKLLEAQESESIFSGLGTDFSRFDIQFTILAILILANLARNCIRDNRKTAQAKIDIKNEAAHGTEAPQAKKQSRRGSAIVRRSVHVASETICLQAATLVSKVRKSYGVRSNEYAQFLFLTKSVLRSSLISSRASNHADSITAQDAIAKFVEIIELQGDSTELKNDFRELVKSCFVSMQASTFMTSMVYHQDHMVKGDPAHDAALQNYDTKSE